MKVLILFRILMYSFKVYIVVENNRKVAIDSQLLEYRDNRLGCNNGVSHTKLAQVLSTTISLNT